MSSYLWMGAVLRRDGLDATAPHNGDRVRFKIASQCGVGLAAGGPTEVFQLLPHQTDTAPGKGTIEERILELEEIEEELRLVADTDCAYAKHAQRFLNALEEARE